MVTALVFRGDAAEEVEDWSSHLGRLGRKAILWVDCQRPARAEVRELGDELALSDESVRRLEEPDGGPYFGDFGGYLHITAYAPSPDADARELQKVECVVGEQWVVTAHDRPLPVLDTFRERAEGSGQTGRLEGPEFLADILEWVLAEYLDAFERIDVRLEELDTRAMAGRLRRLDAELRELVGLRQEIGSLRRALVSHREPLLALARPELEAITSSRAADRFDSLGSRLDEVVQAARDIRDSVVGSFDVVIARTEQRTNEIVKVLTIASVLLLPATLVAGVMGMNFKLGLFEQDVYFWVVLGCMLAIALGTLGLVRLARWI